MVSAAQPAAANPALERFIESLGQECQWAHVLIQRHGTGFRLRHAADREQDWAALRPVRIAELRPLAMFGPGGGFRPLRSAPDLARGWGCECHSAGELGRALQEIYPNSVADWFAAGQEPAPLTNFREFTRRQTGIYRVTQRLTDPEAARVIRAACHERFCLKRRLWNLAGLAADQPDEKSLIPCLEPCAILLELARKAARIEQEPNSGVQLSDSELASVQAALEAVLLEDHPAVRTGDLTAPLNPRRVQLLLEKINEWRKPAGLSDEE